MLSCCGFGTGRRRSLKHAMPTTKLGICLEAVVRTGQLVVDLHLTRLFLASLFFASLVSGPASLARGL